MSHNDRAVAAGSAVSVRPATRAERQAFAAALELKGYPRKSVRLVHAGASAHPSGYAITGLAIRKGFPQANPGDAVLARTHGRWHVVGAGSCCLNKLRGVPGAVLRALLAFGAKR
jgi:hypothetical protein